MPKTWSSTRVSFKASSRDASSVDAELLVLPVFEGPAPGPGVNEAGRRLGADLVALFAAEGLTGDPEDSLSLATAGRLPARNVLLVGFGPEREAGPRAVRE